MRRSFPLLLSMSMAAGPSVAQDVVLGQETFVQYCSACHGAAARGNGPMASVLTLLPSDLTQLSASNGGVFPRSRVIARIDGRDPLVAHGSPMPVFGPFFEGKGMTIRDEDGVLVMTSQPIIDVIEWLERIQE